MKLHEQIIQFLETYRFVNLEVEKRFFDIVSKKKIMNYQVSSFQVDSSENTTTETRVYGFDLDKYYLDVIKEMNLLPVWKEYQSKEYSSVKKPLNV